MRLVPAVRSSLLSLALGAVSLSQASLAAAQAPLAPAPGSTPPAASDAPAAPVIRPYAWIKPTLIFAGSPVESFSQPNSVALTAAGNPVLTAIQDEASLTLQIVQSRLGFWFNEKGVVRGQFEFDFVDFGKSSPTTTALPRLRIGKLEVGLGEGTVLMAGQDWDLFMPVNPYTVDIVAVAFQAGNTAFMRHQVKLLHKTDSFEVGGALGLAAINGGARALIPEYSRIPTVAARAALVLGPTGRLGINAIGTSLRFAPDTPAERRALAGAAGIYGDVPLSDTFNLRFEAYGGRNLANTGALSLGQGNAVEDLDEVGGFVSARYGLTATHALYGLAGHARVLNDEDVVPSYGYGAVAMGAPAPPESSAALSGTGPGITANTTARLGYEYRYDKSLALMAEGFAFWTDHVLNAEFDSDIDAERTAFGAQLGLFFTL